MNVSIKLLSRIFKNLKILKIKKIDKKIFSEKFGKILDFFFNGIYVKNLVYMCTKFQIDVLKK